MEDFKNLPTLFSTRVLLQSGFWNFGCFTQSNEKHILENLGFGKVGESRPKYTFTSDKKKT